MGQVTVALTGDEAALLRSMDRVIQKQVEMGKKADQTGRQSEKANRKVRRSFKDIAKEQAKATGKSAQRGVSGIAKSWLGVAAAAGAALKVIQAVNQANNEAASKNIASELPIAQLSQLAGGDQAKFNKLTRAARQTFREGGASSLSSAAQQIFSLESVGALSERGFFSQAFGTVGDTSRLAGSAVKLQTALGKGRAGSLRSIISGGLGASGGAQATLEELLENAARSGTGAQPTGTTPNQLLAGTAVLSNVSTVAEAGTQLESFFASIQKKGIGKGKDLFQIIAELESQFTGKTDAEKIKFFGRKEAFKAFDVLSRNQSSLIRLDKEAREGVKTDAIGRNIAIAQSDPSVFAARQARRASAEKELSRGGRGRAANIADAVIDNFAADRERAGGNAMVTTAGELMLRGARNVNALFGGTDESFIRATGTEEDVRNLEKAVSRGLNRKTLAAPNQDVGGQR